MNTDYTQIYNQYVDKIYEDMHVSDLTPAMKEESMEKIRRIVDQRTAALIMELSAGQEEVAAAIVDEQETVEKKDEITLMLELAAKIPDFDLHYTNMLLALHEELTGRSADERAILDELIQGEV